MKIHNLDDQIKYTGIDWVDWYLNSGFVPLLTLLILCVLTLFSQI